MSKWSDRPRVKSCKHKYPGDWCWVDRCDKTDFFCEEDNCPIFNGKRWTEKR